MITIGITGILGSGKTTASRMLKKEGFNVIDLDLLAKKIIKEKDVKNEIKKVFGKEFIANNRVDIEKLRGKVFGSRKELRALERILHPRVGELLWRKIEQLKRSGARASIVDGPLLFETGLYKKLDKTVVVAAGMEKIKERLKNRGMKEGDADRRMLFQIPLKEKIKKADHVVSNNGNKEDLIRGLADLLEKIKEWEVEANAP